MARKALLRAWAGGAGLGGLASCASGAVVTASLSAATGANARGEATAASELRCAGMVGDVGGRSDGLDFGYAWFVNGVEVRGAVEGRLAGRFVRGDTVACAVTQLPGPPGEGPTGTASLVVGNAAPTLGVVAATPPDPDNPTPSASWTCASTLGDIDGDAVTLVYGWSVDGEPVAGASTRSWGGSPRIGSRVACSVTATDGTDTTRTVSAEVRVGQPVNRPPSAPWVTVTPARPTTDDPLVCTVALPASDPEGTPVTYAFAWTNGRSGVVPGITADLSSTLPASDTERGQAWTCSVTASDGALRGPVGTALATIANAAPAPPEVSVTPAAPTTSDTLLCTVTTPSRDADGDPVTHRFSWSNGAGSTWSGSVTGLTSSLDGSFTSRGETWTCTVTPNDGFEDGVPVGGTTRVVNTAPGQPVLSQSPLVARTPDDLVCTVSLPSADPDGDAVTYTHLWSNGAAVVTGTLSGSGRTSTLSASRTAEGETWICTVTPSDGTATGPSASVSFTVLGGTPTRPGVAVTPSAPVTSDDLRCRITALSTDPDGTTPTYRFSWSNGTGVPVTGLVAPDGLSSTLPAASTKKGETWTCTVTGTDGTNDGPGGTASARIRNTLPSAPEVEVTPASPRTADPLRCAVVVSSSDADGDVPNYAFAWTTGTGSPQAGTVATDGRSSTLPSSATRKGETWTCAVTPNDGESSGSAGRAFALVLDTPPPPPQSVTVSPADPDAGETLSCVVGARSDADGDSLTFLYGWQENGERVPSLDGERTVPAGTTEAGESWACSAAVRAAGVDSVAVTALPVLPAARSGGDGRFHPTLGMLRYVPAGTYQAGCVIGRDNVAGLSVCRLNERSRETVILTQSLWVMESELTQATWADLGFAANPSSVRGSLHPVDSVSWWEALEAANTASRLDGRPTCYVLTGCDARDVGTGRTCTGFTIATASRHPKDCEGWRLPTEAEWEHAARAGTDLPYSGGADVNLVAWYGLNTDGRARPVCTTPTPRNAWGLCDLSGNVSEWTAEWYAEMFYAGDVLTDPTGPASGTLVTLRGGAALFEAAEARVAARDRSPPNAYGAGAGFRLVRSAR